MRLQLGVEFGELDVQGFDVRVDLWGRRQSVLVAFVSSKDNYAGALEIEIV